ncbi:hypothetical protein ACFLTL_00070 [Chloroflexota bacterium]
MLVRIEATPEVVQEWLWVRQVARGSSDAGWDVYLEMKPTEERIGRRHLVVDTSRDITQAVDRIIREVGGPLANGERRSYYREGD